MNTGSCRKRRRANVGKARTGLGAKIASYLHMAGRKIDKTRILVVDDDVRTTGIFARMLREDGHDVDVVHDGAAAIEQLNQSAMHDVLVTDLLMPRADGITVAHHARSRKPSLPIFVVTGYPERISLQFKALEPTPLVFVKPLDYAALALELAGVVQGINERK